jgi:hypothetical protein
MTADQVVEARAVGLTGAYVRAMKSAGVRGGFDDFIQLRAVGVSPAFAQRARQAGYQAITADELVQLQALGRIGPPPRVSVEPPDIPDR